MTFDPSKHLRNIKGKGGNAEYLDVKWRLVWLREDHPDANTNVQHIEITPDIAIFKATVSIPGGGSASDYGSETPRDFGDYIEKAATKAMGRALAALGYGTQFVGEELEEGERIADSPVDRQQPRPAPRTTSTSGTSATPLNVTPARRDHVGPASPAAPASAQEHPLLATIRDDTADPKKRKTAIHNFYMTATTGDELYRCAEDVKDSGLPQADLAAAYKWHAARLREAAPAPAATPPANRAG